MGVFSFLHKSLGFYAKDRLSLLLFLVSAFGVVFITFKKQGVNSGDAVTLTDGIAAELQLIDSLRRLKKQSPKRFKFNPNFISEYNAYVWGISDSALGRLEHFRANGNWIRSAREFQKITGVSDSLLIAMESYFRFPSWTQTSIAKTQRKNYPAVKGDLNKATADQLQAVYGIGPVLSERILQFKTRYGEFADSLQLHLIYGLSSKTRKELLRHFEIRKTKSLKRFNINQASASDLATLPGLSFENAREIVLFRRLRGRINSVEDLHKIESLSKERLAGIAVYLRFE